MYEALIEAYNDIENVLNTLREAGLNDNRSVIENLKEALGSLDDMIVEESLNETED